ncbi:MAG: hypothetical protein ACLQD8_08330 [Thermoplasmata archaeon]
MVNSATITIASTTIAAIAIQSGVRFVGGGGDKGAPNAGKGAPPAAADPGVPGAYGKGALGTIVGVGAPHRWQNLEPGRTG